MIFAVLGRIASNRDLEGLGDKALRVIAKKLGRAGYLRILEVREDILQDALFSMWKYCGESRKPKSVSAYFLTTCRNAAGRFLTKEIQVERAHKELGQGLQGDFPLQQPLEGERSLFLSALGSLTARNRLIIDLMYVQEMKAEDICKALGCTKGTLRVAASRARDALRQELNKGKDKPSTDGYRRNRRNP
jgi:RNA polymerase sigma factor (sigma-70 family)